MRVEMTVSAAGALLAQADRHIKAGRIPVLKETTKARIIGLAEEYEQQTYGRVLGRPAEKSGRPPSLFDALPPDN
ncbi:MAG TPA: hypothetical protein VMS17_13160 [Gemmataceae bacterium]|nr:hypothetical protein [Gemmataceae bacterium]